MARLLEIDAAGKTFESGWLGRDKTVAVREFSVRVNTEIPSITAIAGESGSGKTTVANMILGFLSPTHGDIRWDGCSLADFSRRDWLDYRRQVQAIFQNPYEVYNPFYRVDRMFRLVIRKLGAGTSGSHRSVETALREVGLSASEVLGKFPHQLSGGQRQRLMLARLMLFHPRIVVADEPVSMIDASLKSRILALLLKMKEEHGISFIYITHDLATAYQIADRILVMNSGEVVEDGPIDAVIDHPSHPYTRRLVDAIPEPIPRPRSRIPG